MKTIIQMMIGALIGFFGMYGLLGFDFENIFLPISHETTIILYVISFLLILYSVFIIVKMKKKVALTLSGDEEDARSIWLYQKFSDIMLAANVATIFSMISFSISLITAAGFMLTIIGVLLIFISAGFSYYIPTLSNIVYPGRELPNLVEKDYGKNYYLLLMKVNVTSFLKVFTTVLIRQIFY